MVEDRFNLSLIYSKNAESLNNSRAHISRLLLGIASAWWQAKLKSQVFMPGLGLTSLDWGLLSTKIDGQRVPINPRFVMRI